MEMNTNNFYSSYPATVALKDNATNEALYTKQLLTSTIILSLSLLAGGVQYDDSCYPTSPNIINRSNSKESNSVLEAASLLSVADQAKLVVSMLGLNKSQLATVFDVSRPTIYAWLKGDSESLNHENASKLQQLAELVNAVAVDTNRPLFHNYVKRSMPGQNLSILDLLLEKKWDIKVLGKLLKEARSLTTARDAKIAKAKTSTQLIDRSETILKDNLSFFSAEG